MRFEFGKQGPQARLEQSALLGGCLINGDKRRERRAGGKRVSEDDVGDGEAIHVCDADTD
jgi:hypothetical protein